MPLYLHLLFRVHECFHTTMYSYMQCKMVYSQRSKSTLYTSHQSSCQCFSAFLATQQKYKDHHRLYKRDRTSICPSALRSMASVNTFLVTLCTLVSTHTEHSLIPIKLSRGCFLTQICSSLVQFQNTKMVKVKKKMLIGASQKEIPWPSYLIYNTCDHPPIYS